MITLIAEVDAIVAQISCPLVNETQNTNHALNYTHEVSRKPCWRQTRKAGNAICEGDFEQLIRRLFAVFKYANLF
jgi:hypothetical protein